MSYTYTPETFTLEIKPKHARGRACPIKKALQEQYPDSDVEVMRDLVAIDGKVWLEIPRKVDPSIQVDHDPNDSMQAVLLDLHGYLLMWGFKHNYDLMRELIGTGYQIAYKRSAGYDHAYKLSRTFERSEEVV